MGEINLTEQEKKAIREVDVDELERLMDKAIEDESPVGLYPLSLSTCGDFVRAHQARFERSLRDLRAVKSSKKREDAYYQARKDRSALSGSVLAMKRRVEAEEKEAELFRVNDDIHHPHFFHDRKLSITVSYHWRRSKEEPWNHGAITFTHEVQPPRDHYLQPRPKRKPSAAKQRQDFEQEMYGAWEHMMRTALYTVRDYFRDGGDGSLIPETFKAVPDSYSGYLNNHSLKFWKQD